MAGESRFERPPRRGRIDDSGGDTEGGKKLYYHLTLLAENQTGYKNLIKLASLAYLEGYYYKPRVDWELLERHHEGLIADHRLPRRTRAAVDACRATPTARCEAAARLQDIFGRDHLFVELQDHGIPAQRQTMTASCSTSPTQARRAAPRDQRQPLRASRRLDGARRSALRADRHDHRRPEALQVRGPRALPEDGGRDAPPLPRASRGVRQHALGRRARRCPDRVRQAPASRRSPCPKGSPTTPTTSATSRWREPPAVGRHLHPTHRRAHRLRAQGHHRHGVRRRTS